EGTRCRQRRVEKETTPHPCCRACESKLQAIRVRQRQVRKACALRKASQTARARPEMFRSPCPLPQPDGGSWCLLRSQSQFFGKSIQIRSHVNVVERVYQTYRELPDSAAHHQGFEGTSGTHPIAFEQSWMAGLCPHKIVATVLGRPHYDIKTLEHSKGSFQCGRRQMRAVAVEGYDLLAPGFRKMCKRRDETRGE